MAEIIRDFISDEKRNYKFKLGQMVASSLTGFIVGVVSASIIWMVALKYLQGLSGL